MPRAPFAERIFAQARRKRIVFHLLGGDAADIEPGRIIRMAHMVDVANVLPAAHAAAAVGLLKVGDAVAGPTLVGHTWLIPKSAHQGMSSWVSVGAGN